MYQEDFEVLAKAAYPLVYVLTHEEKRVEEALRKVAASRQRTFVNWSITQGMWNGEQYSEETRNPITAFEFIENFPRAAIFQMNDLHPFLDNEEVVRKLKEVSQVIKKQHKIIFLTSPIMKIPPELEKIITLYDFPYPNEEDIEEHIRDFQKRTPEEHVNLKFSDEEMETLVRASKGLTMDELENVYAKSIIVNRTITVDAINDEKQQIIRKGGILEYTPPESTMKDVGGLEMLKAWIKKRGKAFSEDAKKFGLPDPKGVILLGVQGCGKSLICQCIAEQWGLPLLKFDLGRAFSGIVGSSEENMRKALALAEAIAPCVMMIDEIDKGASGMGASGERDGGTTARVMGNFLTWQQEHKKPVFVVATCNSIKGLPPELLRKGRFDEIFFVDLPSTDERKEIFNIHLKKRARQAEEEEINNLAIESSGFSGAEIEMVVVSALFDAYDDQKEVDESHLLHAIKSTIPLSKTRKADIDDLRNWAKDNAIMASKPEEKATGKERSIELS